MARHPAQISGGWQAEPDINPASSPHPVMDPFFLPVPCSPLFPRAVAALCDRSFLRKQASDLPGQCLHTRRAHFPPCGFPGKTPTQLLGTIKHRLSPRIHVSNAAHCLLRGEGSQRNGADAPTNRQTRCSCAELRDGLKKCIHADPSVAGVGGIYKYGICDR